MNSGKKTLHWGNTTAREHAFNAAQTGIPNKPLLTTLPAAATPTAWGGHIWHHPGSGPRVLLVIDQPGWAFDNISRRIIREFGAQYQLSALYLCGSPSRSQFEAILTERRYDMVVFYWFGQFVKYEPIVPAHTRICCLIFDEASLRRFEEAPNQSRIDVAGGANQRFLERLRATGVPAFPCVDGVDTHMFKPTRPIAVIGSLRLLWTGYSQHGGEDLKGFWSIIKPLQERLPEVEFLIRDRADGYFPHATMPDWYNSGDIVLCASTAEGTPNPVLEAAACGRPCITTPVGVTPEFIDGSGMIVARDVDMFEGAIRGLLQNRLLLPIMGRRAREMAEAWDWQIQVRQYATILAVAGTPSRCPMPQPEPEPEPAPVRAELAPVDLLTVVTVTTGRDTYPACKEAQTKQTVPFRSIDIKNVRPMDRAFAAMVEAVSTPYFIQVDEDMVLAPDAVERMLQAIRGASPRVWAIAFPLLDEHLGIPIIGCKIYRTEIARKVPYRSVGSCEVDQRDRAREAGFVMNVRPLTDPPVGTHLLGQNPEVIADRYYRLGQKQKAFGYLWINEIPALLASNRRGYDPRADALAIMALKKGQLDGPATEEADFERPLPDLLRAAILSIYGGRKR